MKSDGSLYIQLPIIDYEAWVGGLCDRVGCLLLGGGGVRWFTCSCVVGGWGAVWWA